MKFDLHIHSEFSFDSLSKIKDIINSSKRCGLSGIAITDHNVFTKIPMNSLLNENFWLISGSEVHTELGDIIGLFIKHRLKSRESLSLINEIHDQGGIAILAHPFKRIHNYPEEIIMHLDAIEIVNSRWVDLNLYNHVGKIKQLMKLISGRSAGSDSHFLFEIGRAYVETPTLHSLEELKKVICEGTGICCATSFSSWLDEASQFVNLYKKPSFYQCGRIFYRLLRRMIKDKPSKVLYERVK